MNQDLALFSLWAKTDCSITLADQQSDGAAAPDFHPLIYHLLDVAACAEALLRQERRRLERLAEACHVKAEDLLSCFVTLIALHDLGKCARGFQGKVLPLWPEYLGDRPPKEIWGRHDAAGVWLFNENRKLKEIAKNLLPSILPLSRGKLIQAVCGHHGQPIERLGNKYPEIGNLGRDIGLLSQQAAVAIAEAILGLMTPRAGQFADEAVPLISHWLAGLAVLSDWLGSNRTWFAFQAPPTDGDLSTHMKIYWEAHAKPRARKAVQEAGLRPARLSSAQGLKGLFGKDYEPTPLQHYAETVALHDGPSLFIIEDMTGAGKTEAAVVLAHRLMLAGKAQGLFIALPTMATANAMFTRLAEHYRKMFAAGDKPSIVLTHGRRDLFDGFVHLPNDLARCEGEATASDDPSAIEASAFCADWIARSNKQAFLAQVGAGTIDQALLAVLPARHQSLRLWGLADKVLVIDEAHAYDSYMNEEIERLLEFQAALGGSAIILSATLQQDKRAALVNAFLKGLGGETHKVWQPKQSAYPLVTSAAYDHVHEEPLALRESLEREVVVERIGTLEEAHARALAAARKGAAVAVIRNTVDEAIASFEALSREFTDVLLFHARFAMIDRQEKENETLSRFGKQSGKDRNGILVATQVIEQSLDLDFDLIISDLAPVDLLIQRAGRLWRHEHRHRPIEGPRLLVLSPEPLEEAAKDWPKPLLPKTAFVYPHQALLWRSAKALFAAGKIVSCKSLACTAAETGEVRALVEAAYDKNAFIPPSLEEAKNEAEGSEYADRSHADFKLLEFEQGYDWCDRKWDREQRVTTRLGEEMITLRLARLENGKAVPWALVEDGDWRRAWALSEVSLRRARCTGSNNPPEIEALVEKVKAGWTVSEKEIPVVVLSKTETKYIWTAPALDKQQKPIQIFYSAKRGLELSND